MTVKGIAKSVLTLAVSLGICLLAGYKWWYPALPGMPAWYETGLVKPVLSAPSWIFPQVWMVTFVIMGLVLFLILQSGIKQRDVMFGLILFFAQALFMLIWGFAFFGLHSLFLAFMCIIALWATLLCSVIQVSRFSVYGGMLLVPYFLWVCYLAYLNYGVMVLNNYVFRIF